MTLRLFGLSLLCVGHLLVPSKANGEWKKTLSVDPTWDAQVVDATAPSRNTIKLGALHGGAQRASLSVRHKTKLDPKISVHEVRLSVSRGQFACGMDCHLLVRFDGEKPVYFKFAGPSDGRTNVLLAHDAPEFLRWLRDARTVQIQAPFFREGTHRMEFFVADLPIDLTHLGPKDRAYGRGPQPFEAADPKEAPATLLAGRIEVGSVRVDGLLSRTDVTRIIRRKHEALKGCYETVLPENRLLAGKVTVFFDILENGRTSVVEFDDKLESPQVIGCIKENMKSWRFPKPRFGRVAVVYPISFSPKQGNVLGLGGLGTSGEAGSVGRSTHVDRKGSVDLRRGGSRIAEGVVYIRGELSREEIGPVIRRHLMRFKSCYEKELNVNPTIAGKISIQFTIAPTGSVVQVKVRQSTMNNKKVEACTTKVMRSLMFPKPRSGIVVVTYPLSFSPHAPVRR